MTYKELKTIVDKKITKRKNSLPVDTFCVANQLNLRIKNSIEAKEDFGIDNNPLISHNAVYVLNKGEYTIYYDEHYSYKNFSVAHEIAHHLLGHTSDGAEQHHDAQLMAAIIIAPVDLIRKYKINSPAQLSEICKLPVEVAENYWAEIKKNETMINLSTKKLYIKIGCFLGALLTVATFCICWEHTSSQPPILSPVSTTSPINTPLPSSIAPTIKEKDIKTVYITSTGKKYHKINCRHIKKSEHIIGFSIEQAKNIGYAPCKDCIGE